MRKLSVSSTLAFVLGCSLLPACGGHYEGEPSDGAETAGGKDKKNDASDEVLASFGIDKHAPVGLVGRAVLPAATFVDGPPSGAYASP